MLRSCCLFAALSALVASAPATLYLVNSPATYLRANGESPFFPTVVNLNANGWFAGQTVILSRVGSYNPAGASNPTAFGLTGLFSSSSVVLPSPLLNRIPGAIDAGPDWVSPNTAVGNLSTDIAEDFQICDLTGSNNGLTITIPVGAQYLIVGAIDDFFSDNNNTPELWLKIEQPVPEPATLSALALGLAALTRRRR